MDHEEVFQVQLFQRDVHGTGGPGSIAVFAFKTIPLPIEGDQQIQFGAGVGGPEIGGADLKIPYDLTEGESFPGGPQLGMAEQGPLIADVQQGMEQSGVLNEYLGGFDLSFLDVLVP